jgi:phage gp45-like
VIERFAELLVNLAESGRREQPELVARPLNQDVAIMIVGGLRELAVISLQQGRDVREVSLSASETVKAILSGALL